jgi:GNAT superfamily N-acetyltransferase
MREMALPAPLTAQGYGLRAEGAADRPFLEQLYLSVRWEELAPAPWADEQKRQFLAWQFSLQHRHYAEHYHDADFGILERSGVPAGRLYLFRGATDTRIVDISLLSAHRRRGIGTGMLTAVLAEAAAEGRSVSIHVEHFNPARQLYERLGFQELSRDGVYALMEWCETGIKVLSNPAVGAKMVATTGIHAHENER